MSALGWGENLVGRSHECDYPPNVVDLPVCTGPRFAVEGSSAEIDRSVVKTLDQEPSVYWVDAKLLDELQPTVIITQDQCEVCAVNLEEVKTACRSIRSQPEIVTLNPNTLANVWSDVRVVARALGVEDEGRRLAAGLEARVVEVSKQTRTVGGRPKVACVEWIEPLMIAGNWVPEIVDWAGGEAVLGRVGEPTGHSSWEDLHAADPDLIVMMPCGFDIERTREEMQTLSGRSDWEVLTAVKNKRVFLTDGNQYFNRSGPRLVESVEILAEILHPTQLDYRHRGMGWVPA